MKITVTSTNNILLICQYFASRKNVQKTLPSYFKEFLAGVERNPHIDFFLVTDCLPADDFFFIGPKNFTIFHISYPAYLNQAEDAIHVRIPITSYANPYKLCDLKPALGHIWQNIVGDYKWWGFTDIDIFYSTKLQDSFIDVIDGIENEVFIVHPHGLISYCALFRTTDRLVEAYKQIPIHRELFRSPYNTLFDELEFTTHIRRNFLHKVVRDILELKHMPENSELEVLLRNKVAVHIGDQQSGISRRMK